MSCRKKIENDIHDVVHGVEKVAEPVADIALAATGNAEFIPLANAGITATEGVANGQSIGKSLGQGALAGGEALAGQELAGAVGIGSGNDAFNDALGITGDNPAGTGLPDIGSAAKNALGAVGNTLGISGGPSTSASPGLGADASNAIGSVGPSPQNFAGTSVSASDLGANVPNQTTLQSIGSALGLSGGGAPSASDIAANNASYAGANAGLPSSVTSPGNAGTFFNSSPDTATASAAPSAATGAAASPSLLQQAESAGIKSALPLGALAYDAIKGPSKLPAQAANLESGGAATAPLLAMETQAANEANTDQLTSAQQSTIQQGVQQAQNQLLQQLASSGVQNPTQDSRYIAGMQQIQQWANAQQQAYITQAINEATQAGGAASGNIATVANEQIQEDRDFQDSLSAAFGALGGNVGGNIINSAAKAI